MSEPTTEAGRRLLGELTDANIVPFATAILAVEQEARADLAARIEQRLLVMRATREGTTHPYDNGCVDAIDQSIAIVREEANGTTTRDSSLLSWGAHLIEEASDDRRA